MLSIVVAFGTGLMLWSGDALSTFSISQGLFLQQGAESVKERFIVEFVEFKNTVPKDVVVHIRNVGQNNINIDTVSIVELSTASASTIFQPTSNDIEMGQVKSFTFQYNFNTGKVYKITIITSIGNDVVAHVTA
jgi:hypothetical protein